jgi:hypothetical protein
MNHLPNIDYKKTQKNPTLDADTSEFEVPFYKDVEYFSNIDNFVTFVKGVERIVRTSHYYSRYIAYIKNDIGLRHCQVLSNIEEEDEKQHLIEMHHGPILTLFDYAAIITDHLLAKDKKINSFLVADILLEEHFNNNIQIVMLSKTVHEQVHENNIFINLNQAFGDLNTFLKRYRAGIHPEQVAKINKYIETSTQYDSFDKDVLKLSGFVKKWNKDNGDED